MRLSSVLATGHWQSTPCLWGIMIRLVAVWVGRLENSRHAFCSTHAATCARLGLQPGGIGCARRSARLVKPNGWRRCVLPLPASLRSRTTSYHAHCSTTCAGVVHELSCGSVMDAPWPAGALSSLCVCGAAGSSGREQADAWPAAAAPPHPCAAASARAASAEVGRHPPRHT